jgi:hypothetical protein
MAYFITRVEIHNAKSWAEYDQLHAAMGYRGFSRTVDVNGTPRRLPTAEYFHPDTTTTQTILNKAKEAAASIGKTASIVVSHASDGLVDGLPPAA